jgi:hypothetical protein
MAVTLLDAAKYLDANKQYERSIIEVYASASDIMRAMPFEDIPGNAFSYNREAMLPSVAFRNINEGYTESTGRIDQVTETLMIAGGDIDVDKYLIATGGPNVRVNQEAMKVKALSLEMTKAFFKGSHSTDPKSFDGLQVRINGSQLIEAGSTSGGDALALSKLDELIDGAQQPTHLVMNKKMRARLVQAARDYQVGGFISYDKDEFGTRIMMYNDLPILIADEDSSGNQILPFTELGSGGGTAQCTSIYCLSLGETGVKCLQNGSMQIKDLGELNDKPVFRTRIEWYVTMVVLRPKAACRLYGIRDTAVVK